MRVLVSDTSVLIDLERAALLEATFRLPFDFAVPDLLYEREIRDHGGDASIALGLRIAELDGAGVTLALGYRRRRPALSLPDAFALALASTRSWTLLSGDAALRDLARRERIDCHGVLWLIDRMHEAAVAEPATLRAGLQALAAHPRSRLPRAELRKRLDRYADP